MSTHQVASGWGTPGKLVVLWLGRDKNNRIQWASERQSASRFTEEAALAAALELHGVVVPVGAVVRC